MRASARALVTLATILFATAAAAQTGGTTYNGTGVASSHTVKSRTAKHSAAHATLSAGTKSTPVKSKAVKVATVKGSSAGKNVVARPVARHVPVVVPHHRPPARTAVAAARKAVVRKEPPVVAPMVAAGPAKPAAPAVPADVGTNTGLHLPRYASLKSDDVNMRVGPAERYPVIWTYKRRELPVKIEREFDIWRLVEDMDGVKGWVHQATLTGRRTFVITGADDRTLRSDASETAEAVAVLKPGVVGRVKACEAGKAWCQVQVGDYRGWLQRTEIWGVDPDEVVAP